MVGRDHSANLFRTFSEGNASETDSEVIVGNQRGAPISRPSNYLRLP